MCQSRQVQWQKCSYFDFGSAWNNQNTIWSKSVISKINIAANVKSCQIDVYLDKKIIKIQTMFVHYVVIFGILLFKCFLCVFAILIWPQLLKGCKYYLNNLIVDHKKKKEISWMDWSKDDRGASYKDVNGTKESSFTDWLIDDKGNIYLFMQLFLTIYNHIWQFIITNFFICVCILIWPPLLKGHKY